MAHGLPPFAAVTSGVIDFWHLPLPQEVPQPNFLSVHLDEQSALPLLQAMVCSQDLVCWLRVVLVLALPLVSVSQLFLHSSLVYLMTQVFRVVCKWYVFDFVAFRFPWLAPGCRLAAAL